ncbi:glycosyltransferase family 2 protein [Bacillus sp. HMF5848]|nr:glycosyltransferase family 2 protein [Bacillus sp. HMF5848]
MPLLSIVIPVYNVENYLRYCLKSIVEQDCNDIEVILINDASTDFSGQICDDFSNQYEFIKVIHLKQNSLPAFVRNLGMSIACGKYIHFCDSDDYYLEDSLSEIKKKLTFEAPEVLIGQFICRPEKGAFVTQDIKLNAEIIDKANSEDIVKYFLELPYLLCTPWRFIVKRELLMGNNITFPEGLHSEDEEWVPKLLCIGQTFTLLPKPFYCYRPRAVGSITASKTYLHSKSHLIVALNLLVFLYEKKYSNARMELIYSRVKFLFDLFSMRCDTFYPSQIYELSLIINRYKTVIPMLKQIYTNDLNIFEFLNKYGAYNGLRLYRNYIIEKTVLLVVGKEDKAIYIFPTGYNGEGTARILIDAGYEISGFLDNSETKQGCKIEGLTVYSPDKLSELSIEEKLNTVVVIAMQKENTAKELENQLRVLGVIESQILKKSI